MHPSEKSPANTASCSENFKTPLHYGHGAIFLRHNGIIYRMSIGCYSLIVSEPVRTELIKAETIYRERLPGPFAQKGKTVAALLGKQNEDYSFIRTDIFGVEHPEVRPAIPGYERIDTRHGRSMTESASSKAAVCGGPLPGDIYGARTVKGTTMNAGYRGSIKIDKYYLSPYGLRGFGLMDDSVIPRVIKASKLMRGNGLPTELPRQIKELKEVWVKQDIPLDQDFWEKIPISKWEND